MSLSTCHNTDYGINKLNDAKLFVKRLYVDTQARITESKMSGFKSVNNGRFLIFWSFQSWGFFTFMSGEYHYLQNKHVHLFHQITAHAHSRESG